jgi:hypothetical protein
VSFQAGEGGAGAAGGLDLEESLIALSRRIVGFSAIGRLIRRELRRRRQDSAGRLLERRQRLIGGAPLPPPDAAGGGDAAGGDRVAALQRRIKVLAGLARRVDDACHRELEEAIDDLGREIEAVRLGRYMAGVYQRATRSVGGARLIDRYE